MIYTRFAQEHIDRDYQRNMEEVTAYFIDWFGIYSDGEPFADMLVSLHRLASAGGYTGYTNCEAPMVIDHLFRGAPNTSWRPILKKSWYSDVPDTCTIWPKLKDFGLRQSHYLLNRPEGYELYLPDAGYVPFFLDRMNEIMERLKTEFSIELLANYIQYFVIGHPFKAINFSICMAQVNVILWLSDHEPIYHEHLDFACFVYDYDRIEKIFEEMVT